MNNYDKDNIKRRVIALLTRDQMEFLEKLSMDSLFSTGSKLSRVEIISALIDAAMALEVSGDGVRSKKELIQRILNKIHSQTDRRRYPRLKRSLIVGFRKADSLEQYNPSTTDNISLGGFRIDVAYFGKPPSVHQIVEITMKEPDEKEEPITAMGRIVWVRESENGDGLERRKIEKDSRTIYPKKLIRRRSVVLKDRIS